MASLLPLLSAEVFRPLPGYDVRRWATVFPLGMYAACSLDTGQVTGITGFGRWWTCVAYDASLLALGGLFHHGRPVLRGQHPGPDEGDWSCVTGNCDDRKRHQDGHDENRRDSQLPRLPAPRLLVA